MRLAFVCDTPYQVLTATNLYYSCFCENVADIYIVNQFKDAESIYENLKKEELFDNVFFLNREENRFMQKGVKRYFKVAYTYLNPIYAINNQLKTIEARTVKNRYDVILSSVMTCFVSALIKVNTGAEFSLFDDGTSSYSGDVVKSGGGLLYKMFSKLTKTGAHVARAEKLYVNNKEMCQSKAADIICQIPAMTEEFLNIANRIFSVQESVDRTKEIIFLSQPSTGRQSLADDMQRLIDILKPYKEKITVRLHPREIDFEKYKDFQIDTSKEFWELKVSQLEMDGKVLVSDYSTAQITPKILFDKEPRLLFTYKMASTYNLEEKMSFDNVVKYVKENYRDKSKIMVPNNEEELQICLQQIAK